MTDLTSGFETAEAAIIYLANACDHATSEDGTGFNKYDADFGHSLAEAVEQWKHFTVKQLDAAQKLCYKYRRQLDEQGFDLDAIEMQEHNSLNVNDIEVPVIILTKPVTAHDFKEVSEDAKRDLAQSKPIDSVTNALNLSNNSEVSEDANKDLNSGDSEGIGLMKLRLSKQLTEIHNQAPSPLLSLIKKQPVKEDTRLLHGTGITKRIAEAAEKKSKQIIPKKSSIAALLASQKEQKNALKIIDAKNKEIPDAEVKSKVISLKSITQKAPDIDWIWDESQLTAIEGILNNRYSCLIGAAGTGKTTVVKEIVSRIEDKIPTIDLRNTRIQEEDIADYNIAICFCAFTGRAVQQMKRPLPSKFHPMCNTIHATLGYAPVYEEEIQADGSIKNKMHFEPSFGNWRKLPYKVYIVDESGMVPIYLWDQLFDAMLPDAKVLFVGDINQLPPVQGRSVLGFAMNKWPTYELTYIHRQAQESPIITNAHNILNGRYPEKVANQFDMIKVTGGGMDTANTLIKALKILHQKKQFDEFEDACIVPQNKDVCGQVSLNLTLVSYFNPEKKVAGVPINKRTIISTGIGTVMFAVGDKVMLLANDRQKNLTNGMTGVIVEINENGLYKKGDALDAEFDAENFMENLTKSVGDLDLVGSSADEVETKVEKETASQRQASHVMRVKFNDKEVGFQTAGEFRLIAHAYAFTCHKSQGGEYPTVVILCHSTNWRMLSREWLYTAVTRAQKRVVLLYNERGLAQALGTQRIKGKDLQAKIDSFNALQDQKDVSVPILPKPEKW